MSKINLDRDEWESYVQAKMLQAKLDGGSCSIFVEENFGGDLGRHTTEEVYEVAESKGWVEYVGEGEYLNDTVDVWLTDMGVVLEIGNARGGHVNCHPESHLEKMREMDKIK